MTYIPGRLHPPVASAVVEIPEWDPTHIYAWEPANNYKGWKILAKGEAGVDDAEVIKSAIDLGGVIFLKGDFSINSPLDINKRVHVIGVGNESYGSATLTATTTIDRMIDMRDAPKRCFFENLHIDGMSNANTIIDCNRSDASDTIGDHIFKNVVARRGSIGIDLTKCENTLLDRVIVERCDTGVKVSSLGGTLYMKHGWIVSCVWSIEFDGFYLWLEDYWFGTGGDPTPEGHIKLGGTISATRATVKSCWFENTSPAITTAAKIQLLNVIDCFISCDVKDYSQTKQPVITGEYQMLIIDKGYYAVNPDVTYCIDVTADKFRAKGWFNHKINLANLTEYEIDHLDGKKAKNSGTATFSGDGSKTQFSIAHGLVSTPSKVLVTPMTADAAGDFYVTVDDTYIYINYKTAPASGTDNVKVSWYAEV